MTDWGKATHGEIRVDEAAVKTGRIGPREPSMTPEECVSHGGHCHDDTGDSRASIPPQYEQRCKHCGHIRWAIPQDRFRYVDEMGQPL